jgi:hypothetical protein
MSREKALHNNHHYYDYCCGYPCVKMISFPFFFSRENFCTIFIFNAPFLYRVDVSLYDLMTTTNVVSVHCWYNIIIPYCNNNNNAIIV